MPDEQGAAAGAPPRSMRYGMAIAAVYAVLLAIAASTSTPRRVGDGGEYLVMARRLAALQTPALTRGELDRERAALQALGSGFEASLLDYPALVGADGRQSFLHFWLYPLVAAPGVRMAEMLHLHPNWGFTITNIALLSVAACAAARAAPLVCIVYLFAGPILWWVDKAHTEAFLHAAVGMAVSCIAWRPSAALVSFALAGAQNVAIGAVYPIFAVATLVLARSLGRLRAREVLAAVAGAAIVGLPFAYSWIRLGRLSPMSEYAHVTAPSPMTLGAFVLEPNIGLAMSAPAYLIACAGLVAIVHVRAAAPRWLMVWPALIQIVLLIVWSQNPNANHGGTPGVNRWVLSLLPLSLPWAIDGYAASAPALRRVLGVMVVVSAAFSVYWHLPGRPESYLRVTGIASTVWPRGWLHATPSEVFAERSAGVEPPTVPVADDRCRVALVWDMQWPVSCVPPDATFPASCEGVQSFCYVVQHDSGTRVQRASYNGFFFRPATRSWPAAGPLASGVRQVMLSVDPVGQRWEIADERRWVQKREQVDTPILLQQNDRLFVYIARTGATPSIVLRAARGTKATLHTLMPPQQVAAITAVDATLSLALPPHASNLAVVIQP